MAIRPQGTETSMYRTPRKQGPLHEHDQSAHEHTETKAAVEGLHGSAQCFHWNS